MPILAAAMVGCQSSEAPAELLTEPSAVEPSPKQTEIELLEITPPELPWKATQPISQESFEYDFRPFIPAPGARGPQPDEVTPPAIDWTVIDPPPKEQPLPIHGLTGRVGARSRLLGSACGNGRTADSVMAALAWLAAQQAADGGWSFDAAPGVKARPHDRANATSLVLLAFVGAGFDHVNGWYRRELARAVDFLLYETQTNAALSRPGWEASYQNVLPAYALCEFYHHSHDRKLRVPVQRMLELIDVPADRGAETSLAAFRLAALRVALAKDLHPQWFAARNIVAETAPRAGDPPSALAALHQLMVARADPTTDEVVSALLRRGSLNRDIADDFLSCLALTADSAESISTFGKPIWERLDASQVQTPDKLRGSWRFPGDIGERGGGRLYCTALATLTLEVSYQHLKSAAPVFRRKPSADDFPL